MLCGGGGGGICTGALDLLGAGGEDVAGGGGVEGSGECGADERAHQRGAHGGAEDRHCGVAGGRARCGGDGVETGQKRRVWSGGGKLVSWVCWVSSQLTRWLLERRSESHKTAEDVPA